MARCRCYGCFIKTNAFIVALLSIAVLALSCIVLISSTVHEQGKHRNDTEDAYPLFGSDQDNGSYADYNGTESPAGITNQIKLETTAGEGADGALNGDQISTTESPSTTQQAGSGSREAFFDKHFNFWKGKSDTYILLMQASSGTGIFAGFLQLAFSWFLICGSAKDLKERTKLWNLSNLIVFILLVVIVLVPLSYNTTTNTFKGSKAFWREIHRRIKSLGEFSDETLEVVWNNVSNFLREDLTLFYYVLGGDALVLLGFLVPPFLCCLFLPCRRCCCRRKSGASDTGSDLMLFGTNEPFGRY